MTEALGAMLAQALADRYRIERELGQGGMATVYLARDLRHDREVALKVLRPELAAILGRERFLNEIRLTAQLDHPHIVTLIDSGEAGGHLWYVLPFIRGESLRGRLNREKQLGLEEALAIAAQVASALDYAHARGVIHRDLKPENILLHEGEAMLADFGIALAVREAGGNRLTETGLSLGTPSYMSPEQATGDRVLDARSDVYSLGAVLYEMLAGETPHTGATAQAVIAKLMTERPTRLRTVRDTVPENVDAAVAKALSKVPADRFANARDFAAALRTSSTLQSTVVVTAGSRVARRGALLIVGVLAVAAVAGVLMLGRGRAVAPVVTTRRPITTVGTASQPALSPDGRMVAYVLNGTEVLVQDLAGGDPLPIVRGATGVRHPRWTPDGAALVFLGELRPGEGGLYVVPRLGGSPRKLTEPSVAFALHPQGEEILVSRPDPIRGASLVRMRLKDGALIDTLWRGGFGTGTLAAAESQPVLIAAIEWSPNGRWLAFSALVRLPDDGAGLGIMSSSGKVVDVRPAWVFSVQWSPRSDAIYYFPDNTRAELDLTRADVDRSGRFVGKSTVVLSRVPGLDASLSVSHDGRSAAFISGIVNNHISLLTIDPAKGTVVERKVTRGTAWHGMPTIAANGKFMVYAKGDQRGDNLYRLPTDSGSERPLTETPDWNHRPKISPDGARLIFLRADLQSLRRSLLIMPADGGSPRPLAGGQVDWSAIPFGTPYTWLDDSRFLLRGDPAQRRFAIVDVDRGDTSTLTVPDSLVPDPLIPQASDGSSWGTPWPLAAAPAGKGFAITARLRDTLSLLRASPDLKQWTRLLAAGPGERLATLRWADDDWIYFARWTQADTAYWLSRVRATGGEPELRLPIPRSCSLGLERMSSDGRRLVCESPGSNTYDVWIAENFDPGHSGVGP
jgi:serine/threonine-protein kinase